MGKIDTANRIDPSQMNSKANAAHDNNIGVMNKAGWKTSVS